MQLSDLAKDLSVSGIESVASAGGMKYRAFPLNPKATLHATRSVRVRVAFSTGAYSHDAVYSVATRR